MSNPTQALGGKVAVMSYFSTTRTFDPNFTDPFGIFCREIHNLTLLLEKLLQLSWVQIMFLYFSPLIATDFQLRLIEMNWLSCDKLFELVVNILVYNCPFISSFIW